jgi:DNA-binding transcriptional LysR family regulator
VNVFDEMRQGLRQIEHLTDPASGELAVGCPEIMNAGVLPAICERFLQRHPRVQLRVVHADIALAQYDPLRERKVELLIGRPPDPFFEEGLVSEPLINEPFVAVSGVDSPLASRRRLHLADMIGEAWVLPPHDSTPGTVVAGIFKAEGLQPPRASVATLSVQLTTTLIATGKFVGLLPNSVARFGASRVRLKILPIELPETRYSIAIITVENRTPGPLAKLFVDYARAVAKSLST